MLIDDIEIKIKKYNREKNVVIVNLLIQETLEIRGCVARFTRTKYSPNSSIWIVSPPSIRVGKKYFWIFEFKDKELWIELEKRIIREVQDYTTI